MYSYCFKQDHISSAFTPTSLVRNPALTKPSNLDRKINPINQKQATYRELGTSIVQESRKSHQRVQPLHASFRNNDQAAFN
mmetsp:Transcript_6236/g.10601  ORF Transcript_6236/g.10601 Transcript_6236/m.10601 type:complete len:81 (+) Transcript_6236:37-279(+)